MEPEEGFRARRLYTTRWGNLIITDIERFFFGKLDNIAPEAVTFFSNFNFESCEENYFDDFITYMSVQKLRTPKGLAAFAALAKSYNRNATLILLQELRRLYCATWTECVWQIAEATNSPTKFIISDHPVTVYNRACPPLSKYCRFGGDPDIRLNATHILSSLARQGFDLDKPQLGPEPISERTQCAAQSEIPSRHDVQHDGDPDRTDVD